MKSALFIFTQRGTYKDGGEYQNTNYISMLNVISAFWETNVENGNERKSLNVFLPGKTFCFPEQLGNRFVSHLEDFLCCLAFGKLQTPAPVSTRDNRRGRNEGPRIPRRAIEAEVSEEIIPEETVWENQPTA